MDEAQTLCDRVAIIDGGEIVALDTPRGLVEKYCPEKEIVFRSASYHDFSALAALAVERTDNSTTWRVPTNDVEATLASISQVRGENDTGIETLRVDSATLEDVFLHLTGHRVRE
jgi:ABC-2 type transport system ATP-binding protein